MTGTDTLAEALSRTLLLCRDAEVVGENDPSDAALVDAFTRTRFMFVADDRNLSAPAGQHATVALLNQVGRLGVDVRLAMPDVPTIEELPPVRGPWLKAGLMDLGQDLLPGQQFSEANAEEPADVVVILGDTPWQGAASHATRLVGGDWSGGVARPSASVPAWRSSFAVGGLIAASVASPEPFKFAMRRLVPCLSRPVPTEYMAAVTDALVTLAPEGTPCDVASLGAIDFISGGAITNWALAALLHVPGIDARARVIEPEILDLSNLNRYALARLSDVGKRKIDALAAYSRPGFAIAGVDSLYATETQAVLGQLADCVLVGTDDIPARWLVQRAWPSWLAVGATSHFIAMASSHRPGQACAGCLHPYEDHNPRTIPTVSFVSSWAGLLLAVRLLRMAQGDPGRLDEQQTYCAPLRLDSSEALRNMALARHPRCPVHNGGEDRLSLLT